MPPIVQNPGPGGSTKTSTFLFALANAHNSHPATTTSQWKVTVTTASGNGGTLKTQTIWNSTPIPLPTSPVSVSGLPADNRWYYCQIVYKKPDGSQWVGTSNQFQSLQS